MKCFIAVLVLLFLAFAITTTAVPVPNFQNVNNSHYRTISPLLSRLPINARNPSKSLRNKRVAISKSFPLESHYFTKVKNSPDSQNDALSTFFFDTTGDTAFSGRKIVDMSVRLLCIRTNYTKFELTYEGETVVIFVNSTNLVSPTPCTGIIEAYYVDGGLDGSAQSCENTISPISAGYVNPHQSLITTFGGMDPTLGNWTGALSHEFANGSCAMIIDFYLESPSLDEPPHPTGTNIFGICEEPLEAFGGFHSNFSIMNSSDSIINVPSISNALILDISVGLQVRHANPGILLVTLEHVDSGKMVVLLNNSCEGNGRDIDAVFNDGGAPYVCTGGMPEFYGTISPDGNLPLFNGAYLAGDWILNVSDPSVHYGFFYRWCLWITYAVEEPTTAPEDTEATWRRNFLLYFGLWFYFLSFIMINSFANYALKQVAAGHGKLVGFAGFSQPKATGKNGGSDGNTGSRNANFVLALLACIFALFAAYSLAVVIPKPTPLGTFITVLVLFLVLHYIVNYLAIELARFVQKGEIVPSDEVRMHRYLLLVVAAIIVIAFGVLALLWALWSMVAFQGPVLWWEVVTSITFVVFFIAYVVLQYVLIGRTSGERPLNIFRRTRKNK